MGLKYLETLMLHRPTRATAVMELVPKPRGAVPRNGLPIWNRLPVGSKLPMMPGVGKNVVFSRGKLGEKLWRSAQDQDFLLHDPYCRQVRYAYDAMHDEHLAAFFRRPLNRKRVRDAGLLTADGRGVLCSLQQYNEYRRYLHRLHMDAVDKERELWDEQDRARNEMRRAVELAGRDRDRAVARKLYITRTAGRRAEQQAQRQARLDACVGRMRRYDARLALLHQQHELWVRTLPGRVRALDDQIRAHCTAARDRENRRIAAVLRMRKQNDEEFRERLRQRREDRQREKKMNEEHRWKIKYRAQMNRMNREQQLLYDHKCEEDDRVALHQKMMEEEWLFMDEQLNKIKRKLKGQKTENLVIAITKALEEKQVSISASRLQSQWILGKLVRASIAEKKPGEMATLLHGLKRKLEKASRLPEQVLFTLDVLLESVIKEFVVKRLSSMITTTIEKAVELLRIKMKDPLPQEQRSLTKQRKRSSESERSQSRVSIKSMQRSSIERSSIERTKSDSLTRGVSFGSATAIGMSSLTDFSGPLRSSRDRPPTPVPSVAHLVQEVFKDPAEEEEAEDEDESEIRGKPEYQKLKLEKQVTTLSKRLLKVVVNKIEEGDLRRRISKPPVPDFKKFRVINKLSHRLLNDESRIATESEEFQEAVNIVMQEVIKYYQHQESLRK